MPRIGIDYLPAVTHAPGVGRYARELVRALVREAECPELALFEVGGGERVMDGAPLGLESRSLKRVRSRAPRRLVNWLDRVGFSGDRWLGGVDLFHRTRSEHPPVRTGLTLLPVFELPAEGTDADARMGQAVQRASDVLVFCAHYGQQVARRYGVAQARIHHAPVGADHWVRDLGASSAARSERPRLLVLGALRDERKPLAVLAGFEALRAGGLDAELVYVGRPSSAAAEFEAALAKSPAHKFVRWIREPRESDMPALVAGSAALVHLAQDEGTAVTPLEACAMGLAVVANRLPAFEEALGDEALWTDDTAAGLASALASGMASSEDADARGRRLELAAKFTWSGNARKTLDVWQHMLNRGERPPHR